MTYLRSGETWLIVDGDRARLVDAGGPGGWFDRRATMAHVHVAEPWREVAAGYVPDWVRAHR